MKNKNIYLVTIVASLILSELFTNNFMLASFNSNKKVNKSQIKNISEPILEKEENDSQIKPVASKENSYLVNSLQPFVDDDNEKLSMQFENADLMQLLNYLENVFKVTFIIDDYIKPPAQGAKLIAGNKVTFKSRVPLTKKEVWDISLTFLDMAGLAIVPTSVDKNYRIMASFADQGKPSANKEALPTFIDSDPNLIPNNDSKIRYVYMAKTAQLKTIEAIITNMKSISAGSLITVDALKAIVITDKASSIRGILEILKELDQIGLPEEFNIVRLNHANAVQAADLFKQLVTADDAQQNYLFRPNKKPETKYFNKNIRVVAAPRDNALIVLSSKDDFAKFKKFIDEIDKEDETPDMPIYVEKIKYLKVSEIAPILNSLIQFNGNNDPSATYGGIKNGLQYFQAGTVVTPEESGNRLIIQASKPDYVKIKNILQKLDVEQPQVAIKVLLLDVTISDRRALGVQMRNKACYPPGSTENDCGPIGIIGRAINYQNSGIPSPSNGAPGINGLIQENQSGAGGLRLLGNIMSVAYGQQAGTTLVSLGQDMFGILGILQILQIYTRTTVIANPFLLATHKYAAEFSAGTTLRLTSATVYGSGSSPATGQIDVSANLTLKIIPQINLNDDNVKLEINISNNIFTDPTTGSRINKEIQTSAILNDGEVLALGGLVRDEIDEAEAIWPILGRIPIIGYFFKNRSKAYNKTSLVVLICPEIVHHERSKGELMLTRTKINEIQNSLNDMLSPTDNRDPIHSWFFTTNMDKDINKIHDLQSPGIDYEPYDVGGLRTEIQAKEITKAQIKKSSILDFVEDKK